MQHNVLYHYSHVHIDTGSPRALVGMIKTLDRKQYKPFFVSGETGPLTDELRKLGTTIVDAPVRPIKARHLLRSLVRVWSLRSLLQKHRIHLLHVNEFGKNLDLVLAAVLARVPVILHIHNPEIMALSNWHVFCASRIILVSRAVQDSVEGFDLIRKRSRLVYNIVDTERVLSGISLRKQLGLEEHHFVVCTIAQLTPDKGTDLVVEVARETHQKWGDHVHFILAGRVGEGCESFVGHLTDFVQRSSFRSQVHFLGVRDDVPDILAACDCLLLPTKNETFCLAVVEALAAGLAVISSQVGSLPELIPSADCGILVPVCSLEGFNTALDLLISEPNRAKVMGRKGQDSLIGRLDAGSCASTLHKLYEEVYANRYARH